MVVAMGELDDRMAATWSAHLAGLGGLDGIPLTVAASNMTDTSGDELPVGQTVPGLVVLPGGGLQVGTAPGEATPPFVTVAQPSLDPGAAASQTAAAGARAAATSTAGAASAAATAQAAGAAGAAPFPLALVVAGIVAVAAGLIAVAVAERPWEMRRKGPDGA
jgi:hypothetical protein